MRSPILGFGAGAAFVALAATQGAHALPKPNEKWVRAQSAHFTLISNAGRDKAAEVALTLEGFRRVVEDEGGTPGAYSPTTILVFDSDDSYRPYSLKPDGQPDASAGKFISTPDGNYIGIDLAGKSDWRQIILHEYVHWIVSQNELDPPQWLNEGMAEYYSTFRRRGNTLEIGRPIQQHLDWLRRSPLMPLAELFTITRESEEYNEGSRRGLFYAESWALYHFIRLGRPELYERLEVFLESLKADVNVTQAWKEAFGVGFLPIETELQMYVHRPEHPYQQIRVRGLGVDESIQVTSLPYAELLYHLGEYLVHMTPEQTTGAEEHLRCAVAADSQQARAHAALASFLAARGSTHFATPAQVAAESSEAARHFRRGVEFAGNDDEPFFRWGMSEVQQYRRRRPSVSMHPGPLPADLQHAREMLERCIALQPNRVEAYVGLGMTYLHDPGEVNRGIALLERARNLMPARMDVTYGLVVLYLRIADRASATGLMEHVMVHSRDPSWPAAAHSAVYAHAVTLFNAGQYAEVVHLLDWLRPRVQDHELVERVQQLRQEAVR